MVDGWPMNGRGWADLGATPQIPAMMLCIAMCIEPRLADDTHDGTDKIYVC